VAEGRFGRGPLWRRPASAEDRFGRGPLWPRSGLAEDRFGTEALKLLYRRIQTLVWGAGPSEYTHGAIAQLFWAQERSAQPSQRYWQ